MGVDVVRAVLGVVFDDEDGGLGPELGLADGFDDAPEGEVVVGDHGAGGAFAGGGAVGVVVGQPHDLQSRHVALALESLEFADESVGASLVQVVHVPAAEPGVDVTDERGDDGHAPGRQASGRSSTNSP